MMASSLEAAFFTRATSVGSSRTVIASANTATENKDPSPAPTSPTSLLLCQGRREMLEEEANDSYSFLACLSPSSSLNEPILESARTSHVIEAAAAYDKEHSSRSNKILNLNEEGGESPKCASLASLTNVTVEEVEVELYSRNLLTSDNRDSSSESSESSDGSESSAEDPLPTEGSFDAASVGLMASGLAWVRRQGSNLNGSPINQQSQAEPGFSGSSDTFQGFHTSPGTPLRRTVSCPAGPNHSALEIKSCPTSPSFMSHVTSSPLFFSSFTKVPLASNNSINNTTTGTSQSVASSPTKTQLTPRLNPVNNIYSISSLLTGSVQHPCQVAPGDTLDDPDHYQNLQPGAHQVQFEPSGEPTREENLSIEVQAASDAPSLGYFCQNDSTQAKNGAKSPTRSALARVFSRIGSEFTETFEEEETVSEEEDIISEASSENEHDIHGVAWIPRVRCVEESPALDRISNASILTPLQMHQVARHVLPKGIAACQWKRIYSLARDGDSFDVCLHYARNDSKTLLVVRTTRGAIFGGYAGETWSRNGEAHYYGNNETCLFTFEEKKADIPPLPPPLPISEPEVFPPEDHSSHKENMIQQDVVIQAPPKKPTDGKSPTAEQQQAVDKIRLSESGTLTPIRSGATHRTRAVSPTPLSPPLVHRPGKSLVDDDDDDDSYETSLPPIRVFKYKGVNRYIQYCDANRKMLAFGGGGVEGSFGLCVEREFQLGSTGPCDTFDNEPLCEQENFKIVDVELWGFLTGQF